MGQKNEISNSSKRGKKKQNWAKKPQNLEVKKMGQKDPKLGKKTQIWDSSKWGKKAQNGGAPPSGAN